ncbi:MAG: 5-methyltetrahydropteroyltriglutamate--homocysteine S-methyltransferase [Bergeyella sp.]|nr:5-methyltetrahydropteroyltriglutamate--homocysteine S-methyltransferase [Bergeyella sp.]
MQTHILGYPRIGSERELKKASERYWSGKISRDELIEVGKKIRLENWTLQKNAGMDFVATNDFSFYDHVLDLSLTLGAVPKRYNEILRHFNNSLIDIYFAMARGYQKEGYDITAMEMTKWFDTNYHYIVPEFYKNQEFSFLSKKITEEFIEAKNAGFKAKPVIIGPVSYLLLGKEKDENFDKLNLLPKLLKIYFEIFTELRDNGAEWIQLDEPFLALDLNKKAENLYVKTYAKIKETFPELKFLVATYFEGLKDQVSLAAQLPVDALHIDLVRDPNQLDSVLSSFPPKSFLSLGVVDGRNIWKNDFSKSLKIIKKAKEKLGKDRIFISSSCSLLHSPCDLDLETKEETLSAEIKDWLAFAKQKLREICTLRELSEEKPREEFLQLYCDNQKSIDNRKNSGLIHKNPVKKRIESTDDTFARRKSKFAIRKKIQQDTLKLPLFPTTTIGSFPQTKEVRSWRARLKKQELTQAEYDRLIKKEIEETVRKQENLGIDVLVHGEFERNDMVEYFGEQLDGFAFTQNGWVQSYGSRCVKPPIIYGDVSRPHPMTVFWSTYAQSLTSKWVKGMLTGPVTILQWSFVRDDQPRSLTCKQIALAIRDEVTDLEKAGIKIIQIDEPAIREGLPLRKKNWEFYLQWTVNCFLISSCGVKDSTQIHTHMCYSEFNDIIQSIALMDADVITIECSRSQMELLNAFSDFKYPNDIGPGVYDIHSPRVPSKEEILDLLDKAKKVIPPAQLWVNPDCGLKTRNWEETEAALQRMVDAAKEARNAS